MPADWQLPPGVSRGLWDYVHDPAVARRYDVELAGTSLLKHDLAFFREHVPEPGRVVDLGCGTGRLAIPLAQAGFRVVAVDLSEEMLAIVGEKAAAANVTVERIKANLAELSALTDHSFDAAACLFQTLGMIAGADARRRVMRHVYRIVRPGGAFVLHVHNRWFHAGTSFGRRLLVRDWWNSLLGRQEPGDSMMPPHRGIGPMPMHLFTRREIVSSLKDVGFTIREIRPVTLDADGKFRWPWWFGLFRTYGYLIAATTGEPGA